MIGVELKDVFSHSNPLPVYFMKCRNSFDPKVDTNCKDSKFLLFTQDRLRCKLLLVQLCHHLIETVTL